MSRPATPAWMGSLRALPGSLHVRDTTEMFCDDRPFRLDRRRPEERSEVDMPILRFEPALYARQSGPDPAVKRPNAT